MAGEHLHLLMPPVRNSTLAFGKYCNYLVALLERKHRRTVLMSAPFDVTINPVTVCQLSCPYCATGNGTLERKAAVMSLENHTRIMEPILDDAFVVRYFGTGETLLNKRFVEMVSSTKGKEVFSYITTNLSIVMSDEDIDNLLTSGLSLISVSLDGASSETYVQYRRGGNFDLVVRNMRRMLSLKNAKGMEFPIIEWRFLLFEHNKHEVNAARELAREWGVDILEFAYGIDQHNVKDNVVATDRIDIGPMVSGPYFEKILKAKKTPLHSLIKKDAIESRSSSIPARKQQESSCDWLYFGSTFFPGEKVAPCCISNHEKHDMDEMDESGGFPDVWNGLPYQRARSFFSQGGPLNQFCGACPQPREQFRRFTHVHRAILRNAPRWVIKIISENPQDLFSEMDLALLAPELEAIAVCAARMRKQTYPNVEMGFDDVASKFGELVPYLDMLREKLRA